MGTLVDEIIKKFSLNQEESERLVELTNGNFDHENQYLGSVSLLLAHQLFLTTLARRSLLIEIEKLERSAKEFQVSFDKIHARRNRLN